MSSSLKKNIVRLLRVFCIFVALLVGTVCVLVYLALQEPDYYAEWRTLKPTPQELATATGNVENARASYVRWSSLVHASQPGAPLPEAHEVSFTHADLNVLLANESSDLGGSEVEAPLVRVTQDRIDVAIGVQTSVAHCVLSANLSPSVDPDGLLVFEVNTVRLGLLPLPCETIAGFFPQKSHKLSGALYLDLVDSKPRLTLDTGDRHGSHFAKSMRCTDGKVTVRFVARS